MRSSIGPKRFPGLLKGLFARENAGIAIFVVGLFVLCSLTSESFLRPRNITTILRQISVLGICAFGGTLVLLIGNIDLSIGSCAAFTGIVTAAFIQRLGFSIPLACVLGVLSGGAVGLLNGAILTQIGIPSIVTTIGTMTLFRGLSYVVCGKGDAASSGIINLPRRSPGSAAACRLSANFCYFHYCGVPDPVSHRRQDADWPTRVLRRKQRGGSADFRDQR